MPIIHKAKRRKAGKQVDQFTINNKTYSIRLSDHAELRLQQRGIDQFQAIGTILLLGQKRITDYSGSNRDIFIQNKESNFSIVLNITLRTITIITVIDNIDCWVRQGTEVINL